MNNIITCGLRGKLTQITFEHSIWTIWPQLGRQKQLKKILNSGLQAFLFCAELWVNKSKTTVFYLYARIEQIDK